MIDIEYIKHLQADGNYSKIYWNYGSLLAATLNGIRENLLPKEYFFRISRSHIINTNYLTAVDKKHKKSRLTSNRTAIELDISGDGMKALEEFL
ncbi:MAG: LytTR family DNA-binding domain-containing protein [Bacteroidales bacterium]|nr:LytTR family DNA-binding domain-containing protein [Bacteroidales bacterium]